MPSTPSSLRSFETLSSVGGGSHAWRELASHLRADAEQYTDEARRQRIDRAEQCDYRATRLDAREVRS